MTVTRNLSFEVKALSFEAVTAAVREVLQREPKLEDVESTPEHGFAAALWFTSSKRARRLASPQASAGRIADVASGRDQARRLAQPGKLTVVLRELRELREGEVTIVLTAVSNPDIAGDIFGSYKRFLRGMRERIFNTLDQPASP